MASKILYSGGILACDADNNVSVYKHGNDDPTYRQEFSDMFIDTDGNIKTTAKNPTDADAYVLYTDSSNVETLHVFESKCSPKMKCTYKRGASDTIKLLNYTDNIWSKDIDDGKMTVLVDYNKGERIKDEYVFKGSQTAVTISYDFVEDDNVGYPNQTTASMFGASEDGSISPVTALTECELPCEMRIITNRTFANCYSLTSYTKTPEFIQEIDESAFSECSRLPKISFGKCTKLHNSCFQGCAAATTLEIVGLTSETDGNTGHISTENMCGMTKIPDNAFKACTNLSRTIIGDTPYENSIVIPNGIEEIGMSSFADCSAFSDLYLNGVETIGEGAFSDAISLTSISGFGTVTTIGDNAFQYCTYLSSMDDTSNVSTLGVASFYGCTSLPSFDFTNVTSVPKDCFNGDTSLTSLTNTNGVTSIGENAFSSCSNLLSFDGSSAKDIAAAAFYNCTNLNSITLPSSFQIISIGDSAFERCTSLTSFVVEQVSGVHIGKSAFKGCTSLSNVRIMQAEGESLFLQKESFGDCTSLTAITFDTIVISASNDTFANCHALKEINLAIETYTRLNLQNTNGCFNSIPSSSSSPIEVTIRSLAVCTTLSYAFASSQSIVFYVPSNLINDYITTYIDETQWTFEEL